MAAKTYGHRRAILGFSEIALTAPVFGGDTLYTESEVLDCTPRPDTDGDVAADGDMANGDAGSGIVTARLRALKADGSEVGRFVCRFDILRRGDDSRHDRHPAALRRLPGGGGWRAGRADGAVLRGPAPGRELRARAAPQLRTLGRAGSRDTGVGTGAAVSRSRLGRATQRRPACRCRKFRHRPGDRGHNAHLRPRRCQSRLVRHRPAASGACRRYDRGGVNHPGDPCIPVAARRGDCFGYNARPQPARHHRADISAQSAGLPARRRQPLTPAPATDPTDRRRVPFGLKHGRCVGKSDRRIRTTATRG